MPQNVLRIVALTLLAIPAIPAAADKVYTRDGMIYQGHVRREGEKVIVETQQGRVELADDQVLHISVADTVASAPSGPQVQTSQPHVGSISGKWQFPLQDVRRPEVMVFSLMRSAMASSGGLPSPQLAVRIRRWQISAQDKKRNVGLNNWVAPREFVRRRQVFDTFLSQARELYAQWQRASVAAPGRPRPDTSNIQARFHQKLFDAAKIWPDPLLRDFLVGVAWYKAGNWQGAKQRFERCRRRAPNVAAFHEGYGLALLKLNKKLEALEALTRAAKLKPESDWLLGLIRQVTTQIPGSKTENPIYIEAGKVLREYSTAGPRRGVSHAAGAVWLMPGKPWRAAADSLPRPAYDRLDFMQALAVPAGKSQLVVDAQVVTEALEVYVETAEGRLVAVPTSHRRYSSGGQLVLLNVPGCEFTPVELADPDSLDPDQQLEGFGLGRFEQMGSEPRAFETQLRPDAPEQQLVPTRGLLPGESAGPVFTKDGKLAGFLSAKADAMATQAGPDRFVPRESLKELWKRASRSSPRLGAGRGQARKIKANGRMFIVHAISAETLR